MKGVSMTEYTLGQLFDRLADHGDVSPCSDRAKLLKESRELLAPFLAEGVELKEHTVLGKAFAEP
jgi:hypothetical protein